MPFFKICYTVESSVSCYYDTRKNVDFDKSGWRRLGWHLTQSLTNYFYLMNNKQMERKASSQTRVSRAKSLKRAITLKKAMKESKEVLAA